MSETTLTAPISPVDADDEIPTTGVVTEDPEAELAALDHPPEVITAHLVFPKPGEGHREKRLIVSSTQNWNLTLTPPAWRGLKTAFDRAERESMRAHEPGTVLLLWKSPGVTG